MHAVIHEAPAQHSLKGAYGTYFPRGGRTFSDAAWCWRMCAHRTRAYAGAPCRTMAGTWRRGKESEAHRQPPTCRAAARHLDACGSRSMQDALRGAVRAILGTREVGL